MQSEVKMQISILNSLRKQSLIAQRNQLQFDMLQNSSAQRGLLSGLGGFSNDISFMGGLNNISSNLELANISNSAQLMAINAEPEALEACDPNKGCKLDYSA